MSNQITLATAITWTSKWRATPTTVSKAFLIPAQDLSGLLKEMGILTDDGCGNFVLDESKLPNAGVRAYMSIDKSETEGGGEKLLIVGTSVDPAGNHNDIILNPTDPTNVVSGIYDFTTPCPSSCDDGSPLNK